MDLIFVIKEPFPRGAEFGSVFISNPGALPRDRMATLTLYDAARTKIRLCVVMMHSRVRQGPSFDLLNSQ